MALFTFPVDTKQPYYDQYKSLAEKNGFRVIEGVPEAVETAEKQGLVTKAADRAHWNELGHRLAGERLASYFQEHRIIGALSRKEAKGPSAAPSSQ